MSELRDSGDLARVIREMQRKIQALERGNTPATLVPAAFPAHGIDVQGVIGAPMLVQGVSAPTLWALPITTIPATGFTAGLRVEASVSWTATLALVSFDPAKAGGTPATQAASAPWSGTLSVAKGTITSGLLILTLSVSSVAQARVVTTSLIST